MIADDRTILLNRIDRALDDVRPFLKVDGGGVEVVDVTDQMVARVRWMGNCQTCSMSAMTMKAGIEAAIKHKIPEITSVEAVSDEYHLETVGV